MLTLPHVKRDFTFSGQNASVDEWKSITNDTMLLNMPNRSFAMKRDKAMNNFDYTEIVDTHGNFKGAFAICQDPKNPKKYRLHEVVYQYFDADKDAQGNVVKDSTGFKMSATVEHVLPHGTREEAEQTIEVLRWNKTMPRNLVKNADGKPEVALAFGGWTFEVGGGFNANHIEHGGYPHT